MLRVRTYDENQEILARFEKHPERNGLSRNGLFARDFIIAHLKTDTPINIAGYLAGFAHPAPNPRRPEHLTDFALCAFVEAELEIEQRMREEKAPEPEICGDHEVEAIVTERGSKFHK